MKFLLFSDIHRSTGSFDGGTYEDLKFFEKRAKQEGCDFIIHAGDFCSGPTYKDNPDYIKAYHSLSIPTYHCIGNHDADHSTFEDVLKQYNLETGYYYIDGEGARLIVLNPNYYYEDGKYINYSMANYYGKSRDHLPPEQIKWLEQTIADSENPCIILAHPSFERQNGVKNRKEFLDVVNAANSRKKHSVVLCINGHTHKDHMCIMDDICFFEINSASFEILSNRHNFYPEELCKKFVDVDATLVINDPICAVVEVNKNTIDVKGMKSSFLMGVTKEMTNNSPLDDSGRRASAEIQDFHITL